MADQLPTGSIDNTVRVWDASTGQELLNFPGMRVAFTPDGQGLIAYGVDGIARGFILNIDQLMALAASHVTRALTIEECQKYLHLSACPK